MILTGMYSLGAQEKFSGPDEGRDAFDKLARQDALWASRTGWVQNGPDENLTTDIVCGRQPSR